MVSDQLLSVPVWPVAVLVTWSVQVPLILWPINCARLLNVVTRLVPARSPALNRVTLVVPSGPIRTALRLARLGAVMLSVTLILPTVAEAPWPVIVSGELMLDGAGIRIGGGTEAVTVA